MAENEMIEQTVAFRSAVESEEELRETIKTVYNALLEKGYNPINQIVGDRKSVV